MTGLQGFARGAIVRVFVEGYCAITYIRLCAAITVGTPLNALHWGEKVVNQGGLSIPLGGWPDGKLNRQGVIGNA